MRRLVWAFAGRTYHIVGNLMPRLKYKFYIIENHGNASSIIHLFNHIPAEWTILLYPLFNLNQVPLYDSIYYERFRAWKESYD